LSLLVFTDTGARARGQRNVGRRTRFILTALGLVAQPVFAQEPVTVPGGLRVRSVVLARAPADRPAVTIYAAAGKPLLLKFDAPLGKGPVRVPGVEVRRPSHLPNALFVTPSRALAPSRGPVPVVVPLPDGPVTFTLVLKPEAPDGQVDIYRLRVPVQTAQTGKGAPSLPETLQHVPTPATQTLRVIVSNELWPDSAIKCRVSLLVQTPDAPAGIPMEIRSADPTLCESTGTPSMRADGGR
jgi:hypothetical protein